MITDLGRRAFLSSLAAMSAAAAFRPHAARGQVASGQEAKRPKLRLAFKYNMIRINGSVEDKLNLAKKLGMEGVEVDSPSSFDKDEVRAASKKTGIKIHGVIDSVHWRDTLLAAGSENLTQSEQTHFHQQALQWLQADLQMWRQRVLTGVVSDQLAARRALRQWRLDPDLAGVRPEAAERNLPPKELDAWKALWVAADQLAAELTAPERHTRTLSSAFLAR